MKATDLLKEDHARVEKLFKRVESTTPSEHPAIFKQIKAELDVHAHIEEVVLYPVLLKKGKKDLKEITREGIEEHGQAKLFLADLAGMTARNKNYEAKLSVLMEDIRHHVKEEEKEMFPMVEDQFSTTALEKMGAALEEEKARFIPKMTPAERKSLEQSLSAAGEKGAVAKMMEMAKELVEGVFGGAEADRKPTAKAKSADGAKSASKSGAKAKPANGVKAKPANGAKAGSASKPAASAKNANGKANAASSGRSTAAKNSTSSPNLKKALRNTQAARAAK